MAGSRTLKLSILADVDNLKKNLDAGSNDVQSFGDKIGDFGKKAGLAFAAAGAAAVAYAGKLAIDGVKAAIEDEAAQAKLATSLKNVTGATDAQIKAVEDQILKTSLLTGKTDDELRPSLDRLVRSTNDVAEAQKLQSLALDISAGTGKSLQAVSEALAKAHDGNFTALKKLGGGIDENILKSKDFNAATASLAATFKDQASIQADTFQGKMERLKTAFAESKETVGSYILDAITPLVSTFTENLFPIFTQVNDFIAEKLIPTFKDIWSFTKSFLTPVIEGLKSAFSSISKSVSDNREELEPFINLMKELWEFAKTYLAPFLGGTLKVAFQVIGTVIGVLVDAFAALVSSINKAFTALKKIVDYITNNPIVQGISGFIGGIFGGGKASGGPVNAGTTYLVGEQGPELFTPSSSGQIIPNNSMGGGSTINITVNGALDPISTARQITQILNREATLNGSFNRIGVSNLVGA